MSLFTISSQFFSDLVFNEVTLWYTDVFFYQHIGCFSHRNIMRIISHLSTSESFRDLPNRLRLKYIKWCFAAQHLFSCLLGRITQLYLGKLIFHKKPCVSCTFDLIPNQSNGIY